MLMTSEERTVFDAITRDHRRDLFVELFWRSRDPYPETGPNELRDLWEDRLAEARRRFGTLADVRAQVYLLAGEPVDRVALACPPLLLPIEVWTFDLPSAAVESASVVFVRRLHSGNAFEAWSPADGLGSLLDDTPTTADPTDLAETLERRCRRGDELVERLRAAWSVGDLRRLTAPSPADDWLEVFRRGATGLDAEAARFPATLEVAYPERRDDRTIVRLTLAVPWRDLGDGPEVDALRFLVDGELLRRQQPFESFRYRITVPRSTFTEDSAPLVFERQLDPGRYSLALRIESLDAHRFHRVERRLEVPIVERSGPHGGDLRPALAHLSRTDHSLTLLSPPSGLLTGKLRVAARASGNWIDKVRFELDGRAVMSKRRPPWSVEIDLGRAPRLHDLRAVALDASGRELASDQIRLNTGPSHFAVRLIEPRSGGQYDDWVRARAVVEVPRGERLDRLELHVDERLVATLYQPPFAHPLPLPSEDDPVYLRAVAVLADGHAAESVVFVNAPSHLEHLDIDLVELYVTVVDRRGRPVDGLGREDFAVLEEGESQRIRRFERARDRPFHAALVIDTSTSMADELRQAERAALVFFHQLVTPRDRAAVVTFDDEPRLATPFTDDLEVLAGGLDGMEADGETALHDSLIFTLYHFGGLGGQRAIVLLSDGEDSSSRYSVDDTLEFAREMGVAIYTIGLDIPTRAYEARATLTRLSNQTGGESFFIGRVGELERVYATIEEQLRSQYLLTYQSSLEGDDFRRLEVRLADRRLRATAIAGYYP